jgi:hypothetical protein
MLGHAVSRAFEIAVYRLLPVRVPTCTCDDAAVILATPAEGVHPLIVEQEFSLITARLQTSHNAEYVVAGPSVVVGVIHAVLLGIAVYSQLWVSIVTLDLVRRGNVTDA